MVQTMVALYKKGSKVMSLYQRVQGNKTIFVSLIVGLCGLWTTFGGADIHVTPETANSVVGSILVLWGAVQAVLRFLTKTPVFKKETQPDA